MNKAEKIFVRMQRTKSDWSDKDLHKLYLGFGFECREGGKHHFYHHPQYPELHTTVSRTNSLAKGYISTAVKLINQLKQLEAQDNE